MSEAATKSKKKHLGTFIRIFVVIIFVIIVSQIKWDWKEVWVKFRQVDLAAIGGSLGLFLCALCIIGIRWNRLLHAQKIDISPGICIRLTFLGHFYNNVLLSTVGGDLMRVWYITKHTHKRTEAGFSVIVDRLMGLGVLMLMSVGFYLLFPVQGTGQQLSASGTGLIGILGQYWAYGLGGMFLIAISTVFFARFSKTRPIFLRISGLITSKIHRIWDAIKLYCRCPSTLISAVCMTFVAQSLSITGFWLIGRSAGLEVSMKYYFVFFPIAWVVGILPGILEGGIIALFMLLPGVEKEQALVLAVFQRIIFLLGSIPGVGVYLSGTHLPKEISSEDEIFVDSEENVD